VTTFDQREAERFSLSGHEGVSLSQPFDLSDEAAVVSFYASLPELWASIHLAGGFAMHPLQDTSLAEFRRMIDMNVTSAFLCCREAVNAIRRTGGGLGGRLVNVAARPALVPSSGMAAYAVPSPWRP
jgi:NAD(P)-dependent dehydrogenase (short-subunit alcohol dehydrogenase family)